MLPSQKGVKMVELIDITPDNWRPGLKVSEDQRRYVSDSAGIFARAYAFREYRSRAFLIYAPDIGATVGIGLYHDFPELDCYDLSQLFIDERYQGRGYGKAAVRVIPDVLKADGKYDRVSLCYVDGNTAAVRLYEGFGFAETMREDDEIVMELSLSEYTKAHGHRD